MAGVLSQIPFLADVDVNAVVMSMVKYLLEGLAVAIVASVIPSKKLMQAEVVMIAVSAALTFAVLDMYAPGVAAGGRQGAGLAVGSKLVGGF